MDFDALLNESKALVQHIDKPILIKGLTGLKTVSERVVRRHPPVDSSRAQLLLAGHKVDLDKHKRVIESIDITRAWEAQSEPLSELDLDKDLAKRQQQLINTAIEESNKLTERSFRDHYVSKMEEDWEMEKRNILNELGWSSGTKGLGVGGPAPAAAREPASARALQSSPTNLPVNDERTLYADRVIHINKCRYQQKQIDVIDCFFQMVEQLEQPNLEEGEEVGEMGLCWRVLRQIVPGGMDEKCFQDQYQKRTPELQRKFIDNAIQYLENERHESILQSTPRYRPNTSLTPRAVMDYIQASGNSDDFDRRRMTLDDCPVWHQVFLCFRVGYFEDCVDILTRATKNARPRLEASLANVFIECFNIYAKHRNRDSSRNDTFAFDDGTNPAKTSQIRIPEGHRKRLTEQYHKCDDTDVYEKLMCAIISGNVADRKRFGNAIQYIEDWLWLELRCMSVLEDVYTPLQKLQRRVWSRKQQDPLLNFKVLLLSQQFERAIYYIAGTNYFLLGVHAAIALNYYGLLLRDDSQETLLSDGSNVAEPRLNMAKLILKCVEKPFMTQYPAAAFHYVVLLSEGTRALEPAVQQAVVQLILDTGAHDDLIGVLDPKQPAKLLRKGCVYQFFDKPTARQIVERAAERADSTEGKTLDAIKLFRLAERVTRTAEMLLKQFGRLLNQSKADKQALLQILEPFLGPLLNQGRMGASMFGEDCPSEELIHNLRWAITLSRFFDKCRDKDFGQAQMALKELPYFKQFAGEQVAEDSRAQLAKLDEALKAHIDQVKVMAMEIIVQQYERAKSANRDSRPELAELQRAAKRILELPPPTISHQDALRLHELHSKTLH